MKKKIFIVLIVIFIIQIYFPAYADKLNSEADSILMSAESLFKAMKEKNYSKVWVCLTTKSKNTIVDDVYKEVNKLNNSYSRDQLNKDFDKNGNISKSYWDAFLTVFNPDMVLEQSKWEMGLTEKDKSEIIINYKKSERPAILKMFKEDGQWRVGLVETFWTRK